MDPFATVNLEQQQQQGQPTDGMSFWFKWLIKGSAVVLGLIAILMGVVTAFSIHFTCILAGVVLICGGVLVLAMEVPICCNYIEFIRPLTRFSEGRPHWQKVAVYMAPPILVIILCISVASFLGAFCILGVAALYFMLTIGKKASLQDMQNTAAADSKANLANDQLPR